MIQAAKRAPKPRLVFRVGVIGHRPDRLVGADLPRLVQVLRSVLSIVRSEVEAFGLLDDWLFDKRPVALRAVSSLAEGTDRLFAEEAIDLKYELCCPIPFLQAEFEKDFAPPDNLEPDSLRRFRSLLDRAKCETALVLFEMDGDRAKPAEAYRACGDVVINQSDLLIVVWDGQRLGRRGGTEESFDEARRKGVATIWVDANAPHAWTLGEPSLPLQPAPASSRQQSRPGEATEGLRRAIRQVLALPQLQAPVEASSHGALPTTAVDDFYRDQKRRLNPAPLWKGFRDLVGDSRFPRVKFSVGDFEQSALGEWPSDQGSPHSRVVDRLRPFYAWPDKLAVGYADIYRSAFVLAYLLAGIAVGLALLPLAFGWNVFEPHSEETLLVSAEFVLIVAILAIVWRGRRRMWHERWIDYRLAAELVRHLRLGSPLGNSRALPQVPAQWTSYGDPSATWMAWYVRAVERDLGLPSAKLDVTHVSACVKDLAGVIDGQISYHRTNADRSNRIDLRLHRFGLTLLALTLAACGAHLVIAGGYVGAPNPWMIGSLIFAAGFLPALGAAVAGISNQGEFRRVSRRSVAMGARLAELKGGVDSLVAKLATLPPDSTAPGASSDAGAMALAAAQLMVNEVLDWRVVFLDQPLKPS